MKVSLKTTKAILQYLFRVQIKGIENCTINTENVLIISNHNSYIDALFLSLFLPIKFKLAIHKEVLSKWWIKPFVKNGFIIAFDPNNPAANKDIITMLKNGENIALFPEGRVSSTGSMMKVYPAPAFIADKAGCHILPVHIEGTSHSIFSKVKKINNIKLFPKINLTVLTPRSLDLPENITGKDRLKIARDKLYGLMTELNLAGKVTDFTLFDALIATCTVNGGHHIIAEDIERKPMSYNKLVMASFLLGNKFSNFTRPGEYVAMMLPNVLGCVVTFFAMQAYGRIPVILNFTAGAKNLISACKTAEVKTLFTSRKFIETAGLKEVVDALAAENVKIQYLEDIKSTITLPEKLKALKETLFHKELAYKNKCVEHNPNAPAVVLFTSSSEGTGKGVVLSHKNILVNVHQFASTMNFRPTDTVFNVLPLFHSSGLTGGTLIPILCGMKVFFYPTPLHYQNIPELIYDSETTIFFATDTFLANYAKYADSYDFHNLRYVLAGAEKLKEETRKVWSEKFGIRIFEGYGATETAPIIAFNTHMYNKYGTVGRLMPGLEYKIEPVEGIETGGKLLVRGANVMLGYILANNPGKLVTPENGWYDTGDIVEIDTEGYIAIKGRAKRFAKIAGEMVSLTAVELAISGLWPDFSHAVTNISDSKKGEQIVLLTTNSGATREAIVANFKENGITELSLPKKIIIVEAIPMLGSGKTDYTTIKKIADDDGGTYAVA